MVGEHGAPQWRRLSTLLSTVRDAARGEDRVGLLGNFEVTGLVQAASLALPGPLPGPTGRPPRQGRTSCPQCNPEHLWLMVEAKVRRGATRQSPISRTDGRHVWQAPPSASAAALQQRQGAAVAADTFKPVLAAGSWPEPHIHPAPLRPPRHAAARATEWKALAASASACMHTERIFRGPYRPTPHPPPPTHKHTNSSLLRSTSWCFELRPASTHPDHVHHAAKILGAVPRHATHADVAPLQVAHILGVLRRAGRRAGTSSGLLPDGRGGEAAHLPWPRQRLARWLAFMRHSSGARVDSPIPLPTLASTGDGPTERQTCGGSAVAGACPCIV